MKKPDLKKKKKLLLVTVSLVLVTAIGAGIFLANRGGGEPVPVFPFTYLGMTEFWGDNQESYGPVSTDKIQTVFLTESQSVTEILVKAGDTVKKGDVLMTFDTTLDSLSLERKRLEIEKLKLQISDLRGQVTQTYDMVPIPETPAVTPGPAPGEPDLGAELTKPWQISTQTKYDGSSAEKALICWVKDITVIDDSLLDTIARTAAEYQQQNKEENPPESSDTTESTEATESTESTETTESTEITESTESTETTESTESAEPVDAAEVSDIPEETTLNTEEPEPEETTVSTEASEPEQIPSSASSLPEDPNPADSGDVYVVFKITEGNKALSSRLVWQGMQLKKSTAGSYYFKFFDANVVPDHTIVPDKEAVQEPVFIPNSGYTKQQIAQMRNELLKKIKDTYASQKMAEAEYAIMQKELGDGNVYSEIDGEVISVLTEEESRQLKQPIVKVSGGGGFYVEGSVSELEKENLKPGQEVTINDWNSGQVYTGEVTEIGDFPSNTDSWNGMGNPNVSYYPFRVFIDGSADLQAGSYVSMTYSTASAENGIYLENPFLRSEGGQHYVYLKGSNGKLEKRFVVVGKSLWGSYTQILQGVTEEDFLAFPYGKNVREGAPTTEESDLSVLYGY